MMDRHAATSFKAQAKQLGQVLSSSPFLMAFSLSVVVQGVLLASLESYWQPTSDSCWSLIPSFGSLV
jgi:ATP/ADP translocase